MARIKGISVAKLLEKKYKTFDFDGVWREVMGTPEVSGFWLIYGAEKQGKTWFALKLAEYLSQFEKTLYISAEQGYSWGFQQSCSRAGIDPTNPKMKIVPYVKLDELEKTLKRQRAPKVVIIDNITTYNDELKNGKLRKLQMNYKDTLFVFVAHEEKNEPYTAIAKLCKKLAEIIIRVEGLACQVSGRCPSGVLTIDEEKAMLYQSSTIIKQINQ
ncbi:hypothetical protein [Capnocytophaga catalasegens]|uniref:Inactive STAND domain-containing protein n=1 Tax=Capnocytophaga catalasegens TaxID=1004260 RepID=A0AAV5AQB8_9FLAO|nr:hypothetical protein [Capnocytophaga catalasegens]GIZ15749.1 hypothetical protein RCZ03_17490 [Capnocytophaga catalasegens]GJM49496.1 hypothetical protein RCZ15_04710 [Capnocytophaga catalasegens]GJM54242.1 hypothetical protein RCZ16_25580 [Capnocytophaga catalasegens]